MRLVTFNILHGCSVQDGKVDLDRFATAIAALDADVLALQEVDHHQQRSHGADLTALAAEAMGAGEHRFVPAILGTPGVNWRPAHGQDDPDGTAYGVALLSRYAVRSWQVRPLPPVPWRVPTSFPGRPKPVLVTDEPRVAVAARLDSPVGDLTVVATHLTFLRGWNTQQLRTVTRELVPTDHPAVLMGDLNMPPIPATRNSGLRALVDGPTYPVDDPAEQLDHILATERHPLHVEDGGVQCTDVSDHCALWARVAHC
ncbi:MAG TPA: endonuclease/exonuclease/phosphatase family protein [Segeticoccus sp.]|uniref:endonuclease/exonuclease/phosphatase family protein n=1 Tax=Segeticoccus sp. TaxID=2706531 RepID=UPI002D8115C8|nr:endonuclease/exonuclease/phosphatase family protein [Segeticoccus sp.]HET8598746.1 endonuclease/exonuclease/phosphatase family protein [Segeticoccus sp.]